MTDFERLPPAKGSVACATCGAGANQDISMDREIIVGFGDAGYSMDGISLYNEVGLTRYQEIYEEPPTVRYVEGLAKDKPDHDWRIWFYAPLYEAEYQRQGNGVWVLVKTGFGFA